MIPGGRGYLDYCSIVRLALDSRAVAGFARIRTGEGLKSGDSSDEKSKPLSSPWYRPVDDIIVPLLPVASSRLV